MTRPPPPRFFGHAGAFRAWLEEPGHREPELIAGFWKVAAGRPSLRWPKSVDEALCFGWIDGVRQRIDEYAYKIRYTPRKPNSIWGAANIAKAATPAANGRVRPAGVAAFARRTEHRSTVYSYGQAGALALGPQQPRLLRKHRSAWDFFNRRPPSCRRTITFRVVSATQAATRERRLARLVEACGAGVRLLN